MKNYILIAITIFITSCSSDKTKTIKKIPRYNIKGTITGFADSTKVYLKNINLDRDIDSTFIVNGQFNFTKKFENDNVPEQLWMYVNLNKGKDFFYTNLLIRNGDNVIITGDKKDFPFNLRIKGSKTQDIANILVTQTRGLDTEYSKLVKEYFALNDKEQKTKGKILTEKLAAINKQVDSITKEFVKQHINSFSAIIQLTYDKELLPKDTIKKIFSQVNSTIRKSKYGKKIDFYIHNQILKKGDKYFDFSAINHKGDTVKLSNYSENNKFILLDFYATYCGPCIESVDELKAINKKYSDKIAIVSFNVDKNKNTWQKGLEMHQTHWSNLWDGKGNASSTYLKYGISGVPTFFLINSEGKIIEKQFGYEKGMFAKLLKNNNVIEK